MGDRRLREIRSGTSRRSRDEHVLSAGDARTATNDNDAHRGDDHRELRARGARRHTAGGGTAATGTANATAGGCYDVGGSVHRRSRHAGDLPAEKKKSARVP